MKFTTLAAAVLGTSLTAGVHASADEGPIIQTANQFIGEEYAAGGNAPSEGFNSAGFVQYVFQQSKGISLPPLSSEQWAFGAETERENLEIGDVLFFKDTSTGKITTTGIYEGNGRMIYSSVSEGVTSVKFKGSDYWYSRYYGAKRITSDLPLQTSNAAVAEAASLLGTPYVQGGKTLSGFDCSGYTKYVYEQSAEIYLPDTPEQQWAVGTPVDMKDLLPGDLVFFRDTHRPGISHVGIYSGDQQILNATQIGGANSVSVSYLTNSFLKGKLAGVRRVSHLDVDRSNPAVKEAESLAGSHYAAGGTTPETGFDTGGFVQYVFKKSSGISLPRYGREQIQLGQEVKEEELLPGDLVFFQSGSVIPTIYAGNGQVILASNEGVKVIHYKVSKYWSNKFLEAKRL
ncbi:NlpC/P60 family protein [Bacillus mangrovi]|uniref:NlpC/P60 family protein n=1 Tax=Metabacillus mangrovi TaxID=1491830 RepID=A0A7X2V6U4_9BACI|nr:C40 family peptidase [Metabacillus mangrovi]MTH55484.1 NlpC/P60 family protein [Metabacillus mangrovi]